jgi:hypothetical protein
VRTPYFGKNPATADEAFLRRQVATDFVRQRGTAKQPNPPRDIIPQSAPRGIYLTWGLPPGDATDIAGWRIYSPDENTLVGQLSDRGTRSFTVPATAGSNPANINIFISAVNSLGVESTKVLTTGKAIAESGAPTQPSVPPGFTVGAGSDLGKKVGSIDSVSFGRKVI